MKNSAKIFTMGRSQAVRLPMKFRFDCSDVYICRDLTAGDVILSGWPDSKGAFFESDRKEQKMKRHLIAELTEGFDALAADRDGKITLKHHAVKINPAPTVTAEELLGVREKLDMSRGIFARYLRTNERTLENWEQGRARPNAQAALLIRMVELYPDTIKRLALL